MATQNTPGSSGLSPALTSRLEGAIKNRVFTGSQGPTHRSRVNLVNEFSQSPDELENHALEQVWEGMHQVMVETDLAMDTADHIEEREAVASFYRLMEQIEESMPDDMKERSAHEFLSPDELLAKQSAEGRRAATLSTMQRLENERTVFQQEKKDLQQEIARRKGLSSVQIAGEVVATMITDREKEIAQFPSELLGFHVGDLDDSDQEKVRNYVQAHNDIITLSDLGSHLRSDAPDDAEAYLKKSLFSTQVASGVEIFRAEIETFGEQVNDHSENITKHTIGIESERSKLAAQEGQIKAYEDSAEPFRQQYMDRLVQLFLERLGQDPAVGSIVEEYLDAQNEFYTAAQEQVANVGGLKSLIRRLDRVIHEQDGNIFQKRLSAIVGLGVAGWGGFQTFRGLMNLLPRHAGSLPEGLQDILLNSDGTPNQQGIKISAAIVGVIVGYVAKKRMSDVGKNMDNWKRNSVSALPTKKEVFRSRLSIPKRSAMVVVMLMIIMDITGHMATFLGTDKKKLEGKRIELAKNDFIAATNETTTYMSAIPEESIASTNNLLDEEAAQGGAGKLTGAKELVTVGSTDRVDSAKFPDATTQAAQIVAQAGGHEGMLVESQQALESDLKHLQGMKNISYKGDVVSWLQIPSTVLSLGSGVFDLNTNMEIQEIVGKFNESVTLYTAELQKIATKYNTSIGELEKVLAEMEQGTYADRAPLEFKAIDKEKLNVQLTKLQTSAEKFTAELKKVDPNFDMFDIASTLKFFREAEFGPFELTEKLLRIFLLSFLSIWYMLSKYALLKKEMKRRNKRLGTLDVEFVQMRECFSELTQTISPYLTHLDLQDHLRELFTQIGGQFDETKPMQDQLLAYMDSNADASTEAIVRDIFGITVVRDPWFSELPPEDQRATPRREKKRMKNKEKIERAYQDGRIRRVNNELKAIITAHKIEIDNELNGFITAEAVGESYTNWFLRHEGHTEQTLIACASELIKRSPTFAHWFFEWYNTKEHDPIIPHAQNVPVPPVNISTPPASSPAPSGVRAFFSKIFRRNQGNP